MRRDQSSVYSWGQQHGYCGNNFGRFDHCVHDQIQQCLDEHRMAGGGHASSRPSLVDTVSSSLNTLTEPLLLDNPTLTSSMSASHPCSSHDHADKVQDDKGQRQGDVGLLDACLLSCHEGVASTCACAEKVHAWLSDRRQFRTHIHTQRKNSHTKHTNTLKTHAHTLALLLSRFLSL